MREVLTMMIVLIWLFAARAGMLSVADENDKLQGVQVR